jgi:S-adenosyl methyltransferase
VTDTPGGIDGARANIRANRAFLGRAVRLLAGDAGIRQFLDIGTGIPTGANVHEVAQAAAPDARIVYVDNDPIVLAHAHTLLQSSPEGVTAYIEGDLREPDQVLTDAADTLDFSQPVAVMLVAIMHFVPDQLDPYGIVRRFIDAVPSGSYLALSHGAMDVDPEKMAELAERLSRRSQEQFVWRSKEQVAAFFDGLELLDPGVVPVDRWRPDADTELSGDCVIPFYGAVGRKP